MLILEYKTGKPCKAKKHCRISCFTVNLASPGASMQDSPIHFPERRLPGSKMTFGSVFIGGGSMDPSALDAAISISRNLGSNKNGASGSDDGRSFASNVAFLIRRYAMTATGSWDTMTGSISVLHCDKIIRRPAVRTTLTKQCGI